MRSLLVALSVLLVVLVAWMLAPVSEQPVKAGVDGATQVRAAAPDAEAGEDAGARPAARTETDGEAEPEAVGPRAELRVRLLDQQSSQPAPGVTVRVSMHDMGTDGADDESVDGAAPPLFADSDVDGLVVLPVPVDRPLLVEVGDVAREPRGIQFGPTLRKPRADAYERLRREVAPLAADEARVITVHLVEVPTELWFRLVDGADGTPIVDARAEPGGETDTTSDAQGLLAVARDPARVDRPQIILRHPAYGPVRVPVDRGGRHAEEAHAVEMFAPASLRVRVTENGAPATALRLALDFADEDGRPLSGRPRPAGVSRRAEQLEAPDEDGVVHFPGLGAHQPYALGVASSLGSGFSQLHPEGVITLRPGEEARIDWELGGPRALHGRLLDADGQPIVAHPVWLLAATLADGEPGDERTLDRLDRKYRLAMTGSGADGSFVFPEVSRVPLWVGLGPDDHGYLPRVVRVPADELAQPVDVVCPRAATVRGRLVAPDGSGLPGLRVVGIPVAVDGPRGRARSDAVGRFELGPFAPGAEVSLMAALDTQDWVAPDGITALAGAGSETRIQLERPGRISGVVLEADGSPAGRVGLTYARADAGGLVGGSADAEGRFTTAAMRPGVWRLVARDSGSRVGMTGPITVLADAEVDGVEIVLREGARLTLALARDAEPVWCTVRVDGYPVAAASPPPGQRETVTVPPGRIEIVPHRRGGADPLPTRTVNLTAGAHEEVVLGR